MPITCRIDLDKQIAYAIYEGPITLVELKDYWQNEFREAVSCNKYLVDVRNSHVTFSERDFNEAMKYRICFNGKSAIVVGTKEQEKRLLKGFYFYSNPNEIIKIFYTYELALEWLLS